MSNLEFSSKSTNASTTTNNTNPTQSSSKASNDLNISFGADRQKILDELSKIDLRDIDLTPLLKLEKLRALS